MKPNVLTAFVTALVLLSTGAAARDLKSLSGEVFKNFSVTKKDATGLQISHDDGVAFLDFRNLAPAEQKEFGYDPAAYAAAWKEKNAADKVRREQVQAARQARAKALAAATPAPRDLAPRTAAPSNQTTIEFTVEAPGFSFGPWDYTGRGFSNIIPPSQGGPLVPYPYNPSSPYPYYDGATWGPTIIRRR